MARKKVKAEERTTVRIRVHRSFNGMYKGDEATVPYDRIVRGWEQAHMVVVLEKFRGESPSRQG